MAQFFRLKGWDEYQHYKDRDPPWIKLHRKMMSSRTWVMLDDPGKALAIACMMIAAGTGNRIPFDPAFIKRVAYLQEEPNLRALLEVDFIEIIDENGNPASDRTQMLADASLETDQIRSEQKEVPSEPLSTGVDACPVDDIVDAWNETASAAGFATLRKPINAKRRKIVSARWRDDWQRSLVEVREHFGRIAVDPHCLGRNRDGWTATFDYACRPDTHEKVRGRAEVRAHGPPRVAIDNSHDRARRDREAMLRGAGILEDQDHAASN